MDFRWSESTLELHAQLTRLAVTPRDLPWRHRWRTLGDAGVLGLCVGEAHGGSGLSRLACARMMEALGSGGQDTGLLFSASAHLFACVAPIADFGDAAQRDAWLPRLASGEWVGANAITEAGAGSDAFALSTRVRADGAGFVLDGTKSFVTNAPEADVFLVYAQSAPEHGYLGIEAFVVPRDTPGLAVAAPFAMSGLASAPMASVSLTDVRVPAEARLGGAGQGARVFRHSMGWERTCLFGIYTGAMERQLGQCVSHARERRQFGRSIGRNQAVSHKLADMKVRLELSRWTLYRACWLHDEGLPAEIETSMAKLSISEAAVQSGIDAIQIHGGSGVIEELGVAAALRDAIPSTIFSGTSEMQREIIARELGL